MNESLTPITAIRLTAPGRGAVASVRLSFDAADTARFINDCFVAANGMSPASAPIDRVLFGSWRGEDVVVVRTGELEWEVHCHGGEAAVTRILSEFATNAERSAILSPLDALLLRTRTPRTARLALAQANGILRDALDNIACSGSETEFFKRTKELLRWEHVARHLDEPWHVVIAGPPNVGKSSLLNAIAGYERTIVFDQPGTTRDAVRTDLIISGWPFCFVDTAGIRNESDDPIEQEGIRNARSLIETADLVLVAVDQSAGWQLDHGDLLSRIPDATPRAVVICKADLETCGDAVPDSLSILETSARQEAGVSSLIAWITHRLIPHEPTLETALPVAGTAAVCRSMLERLDGGHSIETLRESLKSFVKLW